MKCIVGVLLCASVLSLKFERRPPRHRSSEERGEDGGQAAEDSWRMWPGSSDGMIYVPVSFESCPVNMMRLFLLTTEPLVQSSCIRFIQRTTQKDYLNIDFHGCSSRWGRQGGAQNLSLSCGSLGSYQRELLHSLGLSYETQRPDRDQYVQIHWENMQEDKMEFFHHRDSLTLAHLQTAYDYSSVMHFPSHVFSKNGQRTLVASAEPTAELGSDAMTVTDLERVNLLYCFDPNAL